MAASPPRDVSPYDALLVVSFGGPEGPDDVLPFLENVTRGRSVPRERLAEVGAHYHGFGGRSPINDQCRALVAAVEDDLAALGLRLPVYWGNRNWAPYLADTVERMAADGVRRAACLVTSAYSSYAGCRQYRENLYDAVAATAAAREGPGATVETATPRLDRLRHYHNHPGFVEPFVEATLAALDRVPPGAQLVFVTHSVPAAMNAHSGPHGGAYVAQHELVAELVAAGVAAQRGAAHGAAAGETVPWDLVYCSRSGPPHVPWLEPDVNDHLETVAAAGASGVTVVPIGFVSDHMEVVYDLDTEAAQTAARLGLPFARASTPGTDPRFVAMVRDLLLERAAVARADQQGSAGDPVPRATVDGSPPSWDRCPTRCCPNPRGERLALCGGDG